MFSMVRMQRTSWEVSFGGYRRRQGEGGTMSKAIGETAGPGEERPWSNSLARGRVPGPRLREQRVFDDVVGPSTQSVHSGTYIDPMTGAVGTPIFTSSTFEFNEHTYGAFDQGHIRDVAIYGR